jgi:hypothetical protein
MEVINRQSSTTKISVVLPSRKRIEMLNDTLFSIFSNADPNNVNFEVLVKLDLDDHESIDYIKNWSNEFENITFITNSRKKGWLNMVDFVENLIRCSQGKWILSINDDVVIKTHNWNTLLEKYLTEFKIFYPDPCFGYRWAFPIFPKKIYEVLGHISPHNQIDTYLYELGEKTNLNLLINDVKLEHYYEQFDEIAKDKTEVIDINYMSRNYHFNSPEFKQDIEKLIKYLNSDGSI